MNRALVKDRPKFYKIQVVTVQALKGRMHLVFFSGKRVNKFETPNKELGVLFINEHHRHKYIKR